MVMGGADAPDELGPRHAGHPGVGHHHGDGRLGLEYRKPLAAAAGLQHAVPAELEPRDECRARERIVVYQEHYSPSRPFSAIWTRSG